VDEVRNGISWSRVERRLRNAENYWLATTRPDGRPHSMPVYGLWEEGCFWFGTGLASVKGRNIAAGSDAVVHLESGDDVVIVEGTAEVVADGADPNPVTPRLAAKYGMSAAEMEIDDPASGAALYRVRPKVVLAWLEGAFPQTRSRWELS